MYDKLNKLDIRRVCKYFGMEEEMGALRIVLTIVLLSDSVITLDSIG